MNYTTQWQSFACVLVLLASLGCTSQTSGRNEDLPERLAHKAACRYFWSRRPELDAYLTKDPKRFESNPFRHPINAKATCSRPPATLDECLKEFLRLSEPQSDAEKYAVTKVVPRYEQVIVFVAKAGSNSGVPQVTRIVDDGDGFTLYVGITYTQERLGHANEFDLILAVNLEDIGIRRRISVALDCGNDDIRTASASFLDP